MKLIIGAFVCFVALVASNAIDICGMTEKEVWQIEFDSNTVLRHPSELFLTCKDFIKFTLSERVSFGTCYKDGAERIDLLGRELRGWPIDSRWEMAFSKCQRALEKKEEPRPSTVKQIIDVCPMKQEEVDQIAVKAGTVFVFSKTEMSCHEIRQLAFPARSKLMTCYYMKPEEQWAIWSGWGHWYDQRGTTIYAKCLELAYESIKL